MTQEKNKHQKYSKIYQSWPTAVFYQPAMWKLHFKAAARENRKFAIPRLRLGERGVTTSAADTFPVRSRGQQRLRMWKESDRASRFILPGVRPVQRQFPEKHWLEAIKVVADSTSGWMAFSFSNSTMAEGWGITLWCGPNTERCIARFVPTQPSSVFCGQLELFVDGRP